MNSSAVLITVLSLAFAADENAKVVIPFDFESRFDNGRYGQMVGDMIWKKLEREGKFVIPETMLDVRDVCDSIKFRPNYQTSIEEVGKVLRDEFGGDIAIWGTVERVPPNTRDVYDLGIKVVDFSGSKPVVIWDEMHRTKTVSEIPHLYMANMMMKLHGRKPGGPAPPDPAAERRWREDPNLLSNGSFERGRRQPEGWDPLPKYVSLVSEDNNQFIRMTFPAAVADSTGVLYYSEYFPIEAHATYRFSCRYRTTGSQAKVFIKCYDFFQGPKGSKGRKGTGKTSGQWREVYRSQQNMKGEKGQWNSHVQDFTPKHSKFTPRRGRIMLYAYHPAGTVEWDDVVLKKIKAAPRK